MPNNNAEYIEHSPRSNALKWGSLVVMSLALAIIIIDTTLLNVSLSYLIKDLHTTIQRIQWVITAYALILTGLTITGGRLGDIFGRKKMFLLGAVLFGIGSFIASISNSFGTLLLGESIIEGLGAALMMPATASLLVSTFQGKERAIAFGVWGAIAGAASAIGPILGGWLTTDYTWRYGFRINIVVVILLLLGSFIVRDVFHPNKNAKLDLVGVLLSSLGLFSVVFGIIEASTYGWWKVKENFIVLGHSLQPSGGMSVTPGFIGLGIIILLSFILWEERRENRGQTPLVSMHLFQIRQFISGAFTLLALSLGMAGIIFILPVFLQGVQGKDALHTGLILLPLSVALLVTSPLAAALSHKFAPKYLIQLGLFLDVIAVIVLRQTIKVDVTPLHLAPGLVLYGVGMGLVQSQINNLILSSVPVQEAGEASGVSNTFRQLGSALGSAIIGTVLLSTIPTNIANGVADSTVIPAQAKTAIASGLAKAGTNIEFSGGQFTANPNAPKTVTNEVDSIVKRSITNGDKEAVIYAGVFAVLALLVSTQLPKTNPAAAHQPEKPAPAPIPNEQKKEELDAKPLILE